MSAFKTSWSVTPAAANATLLRAAAAVAAAGPVTLLRSAPSSNGCGYKLLFTSAGNSSGMTYTIVGTIVGQTHGTTTEVLTGPNATTGTTTNYWASITSITASAAATGDQSIGITGSLAMPMARIRGVHYVGAAAAGSISVAMATGGDAKLTVDTPASAAFAQYLDVDSILLTSATPGDYAVVTLTQVTKCTFICC